MVKILSPREAAGLLMHAPRLKTCSADEAARICANHTGPGYLVDGPLGAVAYRTDGGYRVFVEGDDGRRKLAGMTASPAGAKALLAALTRGGRPPC